MFRILYILSLYQNSFFVKVPVFGILEKENRVFTVVVEKVNKETLMEKIKKNLIKGSVYYTDSFKSYNSLDKFGKHFVIDHIVPDVFFIQ